MTTATEKQVVFDSLVFVENLCFGHIDFDYIWGEFGKRGRGIRFGDGAQARLGQIFGFIHGVAQADRNLATSLAGDILKQLDWLANYGGNIEGHEHLPRYILDLRDDGTWGGFSLAWYVVTDIKNLSDVQTNRIHPFTNEYHPQYRWVFAMNGGLLFHGWEGSGTGTPYAVRIGSSGGPWSIHT